MIKITKNNDDFLIEYIDQFNYLDENYDRMEAEEKMIRKKIHEVKSKRAKLISNSKYLSLDKD